MIETFDLGDIVQMKKQHPCGSKEFEVIRLGADIKIKCVEADTTQAALAEKIGKTVQYVNRIVKKDDGVVNKTFIQMMEGLGYDIRLIYEKREDNDNE